MNQTISNRTLVNCITICGFTFLMLYYNHVDMHIPLKMFLYTFVLAIINICFFNNKQLIVNISEYTFKSYCSVYASLLSIYFAVYFIQLISPYEVPNNFAVLMMYSISLAATYWILRLFNEMFNMFGDFQNEEKTKKTINK